MHPAGYRQGCNIQHRGQAEAQHRQECGIHHQEQVVRGEQEIQASGPDFFWHRFACSFFACAHRQGCDAHDQQQVIRKDRLKERLKGDGNKPRSIPSLKEWVNFNKAGGVLQVPCRSTGCKPIHNASTTAHARLPSFGNEWSQAHVQWRNQFLQEKGSRFQLQCCRGRLNLKCSASRTLHPQLNSTNSAEPCCSRLTFPAPVLPTTTTDMPGSCCFSCNFTNSPSLACSTVPVPRHRHSSSLRAARKEQRLETKHVHLC
eukprot:1157727-Pelagomonas_calceolata.AAC.7